MPYYGPAFSRRTSNTNRNLSAARIQRRFRVRKFKRNLRNRKKPSALARSNKRAIMKLTGSSQTFYDKNMGFDISTTGVFHKIGLQDLAQGDGEGNRQGDKVTIKSIQLRLYLSVLNTSVPILLNDDAFNNVRLILIQLECPPIAGALFQTTDVLQYDTWFSLYRKRPDVHYKVLMDKTYYMDNQGFGTGQASNPKWQPVSKHQAVCDQLITFPKGLEVTFAASSAQVIKNDLVLLAISDSSVTGHPGLSGWCRLNLLP
ncbi:MAG: putative coat protein [Cressdnaviricota sp.]|nr:MAG: putative coat protein [Cressdnaviricota sp.]